MSSKVDLTFLGTSDQMPSRTRNHTSILIDFNEEHILVDCGEGTQRQFRKAEINPGKVTRILITHWHGDHILGLPGLLSTLSFSSYNKTLFIYGPKGIKEKVKKMLEVFSFHKTYEIKIEEVSRGVIYEGKDFFISCEEMEHGTPALAYSFNVKGNTRIDKVKLKKSGLPEGPLLHKVKEGKDVTYNGKKFHAKDLIYKEEGKKISVVLDTKMNKRIIPFVKDSDIFVCEGTYSGDFLKEAEEHLHMTIPQGSEVAKKGKVKKLIFTHVGSRHSKDIKELLDEAKKVFKETIIVKDFDKFEV